MKTLTACLCVLVLCGLILVVHHCAALPKPAAEQRIIVCPECDAIVDDTEPRICSKCGYIWPRRED